jgi:hypothetical protein
MQKKDTNEKKNQYWIPCNILGGVVGSFPSEFMKVQNQDLVNQPDLFEYACI